MASLRSLTFIPYLPPPSILLPSNSQIRLPAQKKQPISLLTCNQKIQVATATLPLSRSQTSTDGLVVGVVETREDAISTNDNNSDNDDFPSLEDLFQASPRAHNRKEAPGIEPCLQTLDQQVEIQDSRIDPAIDGRQGDTLGKPIYLDDNEPESASTENKGRGSADDIETDYELDIDTFRDLDPTDKSGLWYNVDDEGQCIGELLRPSVQPSPHLTSPLSPDFDGWTEESTAELEKAVELASAEQTNLSSISRKRSSTVPSIDIPEKKIETPTNTKTTDSSKLEEDLQNASREPTTLHDWERQDLEEIYPRYASTSGPSSLALGDTTELVDPEKQSRREVTHRQISYESQHSIDKDATGAISYQDQRHAKRRKLCSTPALSTPQLQVDDGCVSECREKDQQWTSCTSRGSSVASKDCFAEEDEELDELAMEGYSLNDDVGEVSDDFEDEDYIRDTSDDDEDDDFQVAKRSTLSSLPYKRYCFSAKRGNVKSRHRREPHSQPNEQLQSPPTSQSAYPFAESVPIADYQEWTVHGALKRTRIEHITTFTLEFQVANLPEHEELAPALKAMCNTMADRIFSESNIFPSPYERPKTHEGETQPPKQLIKPCTQAKTTQNPVQRSKAHHKRKPIRWTVEEEVIVARMRKKNASWKDIFAAVPSHSPGSITGHWYGNLCKRH